MMMVMMYHPLLQVYPDEQILRMWRCTGEELPGFLVSLAEESADSGSNGNEARYPHDDPEHESHHVQLPTLPMKLNAHSANPVLDALKQIDHHKAVIQYLDQAVKEKHQYILLHASTTYQTPEDLLSDRITTAAQMKQRVEDCLRLVKIRNVRCFVALFWNDSQVLSSCFLLSFHCRNT